MQVIITHQSFFGLFSRVVFAINILLVALWSATVLYSDPFQSWMPTYCGGVAATALVVLVMVPLGVLGEYPLSWESRDRRWRVHVRRALRATFLFALFLDPYIAYPALRWCAAAI